MSQDISKDTIEAYIEACQVFRVAFFPPTYQRLLQLMKHRKPGVRIYAILFLTEMAMAHLPAFSTELLADVVFHLKLLAERDADLGVQNAAADRLNKLLDAIVAYGKACREARRDSEQSKKPIPDASRN